MAPFASGTRRTRSLAFPFSTRREVEYPGMCQVCAFNRYNFTTSHVLAEHGTPTSVAFVATDPNQVVVSFDGGETVLYDLTTEQSTTALETQTKDGMFCSKCVTADFPSSEISVFPVVFTGSELINRVVSHPSEPVSITAHENRTIRFLDNKTGVYRRVNRLHRVTHLEFNAAE